MTALLEARGLSRDFSISRGLFAGRRLLRAVVDLEITVDKGEVLGIVGESGSGKSTLAMALLGLQRTTSGEIDFQGRALGTFRGHEQTVLRSNMQVVFQDPFSSLSPRQTIERIVGEGLALHRPHLDAQGRREKVISVLREVGLDRTVQRPSERQIAPGVGGHLAVRIWNERFQGFRLGRGGSPNFVGCPPEGQIGKRGETPHPDPPPQGGREFQPQHPLQMLLSMRLSSCWIFRSSAVGPEACGTPGRGTVAPVGAR